MGDAARARAGLAAATPRGAAVKAEAAASDRVCYANNASANEHFVDNVIITCVCVTGRHVPRALSVVLLSRVSLRCRSSFRVPLPSLLHSSRYTWYNFVPVFLLEQFMRMANAYFLFVCILQSIPTISLTGGVPTSLLPLSVVLLFDGVVTAREDYKRHVDDHKANNSESECVDWRWAVRTRGCSVPSPCSAPPSPPYPPPPPSSVDLAWRQVCAHSVGQHSRG